MVPSLSLGAQYTLLVAVPSVVALLLGKRLFLPDTRLRDVVRDFFVTDWRYLGVAWVTTYAVNTLAMNYHVPHTYTNIIYAIEGGTVELVQVIATPALTVFCTLIYLVGFPFVVLFTYFKVKAHDPQQAYRYAFAYATLVLLAVPFFLLFPVKITSLYLSNVQPLMYDLSPIIRHGVYSTDTLVKAFPSLHTGLSVLAAIYARKADERYANTIAAITACIIFSTIYLGVHWITDAVVALLLVSVAYTVSQQISNPKNPFANLDVVPSRGERSHR